MKQMPVVLLLILILLGSFTIWRYTEVMAPVWTVTAAQESTIDLQKRNRDALVDAAEHARRAVLLTQFLQGAGVGILFFLFGAGGLYAWVVYHRRQESFARAVDGQYALQTLRANGQTWVVDPNKSAFGVWGVEQKNGAITTDASMIGADRQLAYATVVQKTRTASAVTSGDGFRYASTGKFLAGGYDKAHGIDLPQLEVADDEPLPNNWQALTLQDAFAQAQPDRWLLGQNATGACEFNLRDNIHSGLLGATGTGKTASTALLMAMCAIKHRLHVIALDGKGGVDWAAYNKHLEAWPTDYTVVGDQVSQIVKIHELRMKDIKRAGVANIYDLDYGVKPLFVILEEFGFTMQALKAASKRTHDAVESDLSNLMRVSRSTGIHFLLIDQSAQHWPGVIKANVKAWFAYRLGGQQGNAFNAYNLHELKPKGQFWHNDNVYDAWYTKGEAKPLLQKLPVRKYDYLTDAQYTVTRDNTSTSDEIGGEGTGPKDPPRTVTSEAVIAPVIGGDTGEHHPQNSTSDGGAKAVTAPVLTGKPITAHHRQQVLNIHAMTGSKNETMRLVWGGKNVQRAAWLNEILQGGEVQQ